ncbi:Type I restriction enzyme EcoAI R protein [Planktothrix agardhii]|uniref:Type III restriction enzyme, res subunit family n=2 Tax=Planktothrix agardhii TaxID=1160 RepID=A0A1J1JNS6_PLAAG|nr:DEAD/DEAH box helicase family protein [Planktothrix agardhii]AQY61175.1 Type I site-specific deoxyribonuclease [Planktothrix agardhii NIVA-CYA 68]CAD5915990.1 Type I restriction enzyme EcoAI R protein [Planktothrix agardhii]CUM61956.1 Type III restriction enzyme, res subunit family [Planktothrix agardhii]
MSSNFDFLKPDFPEIYESATRVETLALTDSRACCFYARYTLEQAVIWLYDYDPYLILPYDNNLGALIHEQTFKDNLPPNLFPKVRIIHKMGNNAAHSNEKINEKDADYITQELFHFLYWLCRYYSPNGKNLPQLQYIPPATQEKVRSDQKTLAQLQKLEQELSQAQEIARIAQKAQQQTEAEYNQIKAEISQLKQANSAVKDHHDYNEIDTRKYLIDVLLKEMGWDLTQPHFTEYEITGMPQTVNPTGKGYIDYVLWDDNGLPLAIIEAKRTQKDANLGKRQAQLYANCLEKQFNQRPIIFYSNGYQTYLWDDGNYPPRLVEGFLKKDELQRIIYRRTHRKPFEIVLPNPEIAGRSYQLEALKRVTETFNKKARKALLVMATGTGKTRTAIALVDILTRANWIKRVLFLADRTSLITQAKRAIQKHLPHATAIDLTQEKDVSGADIILSTYKTMMNRINNDILFSPSSRGGEVKTFGVGYFDLIIIDEAHRSIYQKYQALFTYFDALLIGLTATPRNEINRDTYGIFELEAGNPTFAYELQDAIADGYLVPPTGINVPFKFLRSGVKYADLTPEEKIEYEEKFYNEETGEIPKEINAAALNRWLFNIDTVDKALEILMDWGLKIHQGDRLGKTIIFARNHQHAQFIEERFNYNYPQYKGKFARVIDSYNNYAQSLLDDFSEAEKEPMIAISVDMLDTGVDVPEVVNLMFFKPVYSEVKFNQMIGRGTRLCPNLFGFGKDKTEFLIFDLCDNFTYFNQEITEKEQSPTESLQTRLLKAKLELWDCLNTAETTTLVNNPQNRVKESQASYTVVKTDNLKEKILDELHQHVASMEENNFLVRRYLETVLTFRKREKWQNLNPEDRQVIVNTLIPLPNTLPAENPRIKNFDLLCLKIQLAILKNSPNFERLRDQVRDLLTRLETKKTIPIVKNKLNLIEQVQTERWWQDVTVYLVEEMRLNFRDLMVLIDQRDEIIIYTDFEDELGDLEILEVPNRQTGFSRSQYRKKVESYILAHQDHIAIAKLKRNLPLTDTDLQELEKMLFTSEALESRDKFELVYSKNVNLKSFILELVGLDRNTAKQAFSKYLENNNLNANQIRFIEQIINWLTQRGVMKPSRLYESPFTDIHTAGLDGVFNNEDANNIITIIRSFDQPIETTFYSA